MSKMRTAERLRKASLKRKKIVKSSSQSKKLCQEQIKVEVPRILTGKEAAYHSFKDLIEIHSIRACLLSWYDKSKRELPWRRMAVTESDLNKRAYAVWVSEIMLQQTQVVTVINYYNKWMQRWPTLQDLAKATLEEVNEMWSGLGYYSRGRRLYEGAQKVISEFKGEMPQNAEELQKQLPGVGRYTASAIASIAFGQVLKKQESVSKRLLGNTLSKISPTPDIEECENCSLCLPNKESWVGSLGVMNFPRKAAKKLPRAERTLTCVVTRKRNAGDAEEYFLVQRPNIGLLAGMWEFPSILLESEMTEKEQKCKILDRLTELLGSSVTEKNFQFLGEVVHIFSHIHQTYVVYSNSLNSASVDTVKQARTKCPSFRWVTKTEFQQSAVSTAMKKVLQLFSHSSTDGKLLDKDVKRIHGSETNRNKQKERKHKASTNHGGKQLSMDSFFRPTVKESL
ncbi:adenine DNA glycosylase isoform X3 [Chiloscyllium plagiosum]|uniref:adenine DNA glycosylase isoform X3 n=1 Tax=Chiloscyllium plagiosum TaxID=36176 RepID=UPI001CB8669A|nr:adenine DNA glycosylase isoform X3 [Chiloscyllium plagiosum]